MESNVRNDYNNKRQIAFPLYGHQKGWNIMGKDLKGKELGKGISQRKDGRYCGRFTDRFGRRQSVYSFKLSELRSLMNTAVYENEKRLNVYNENITLNDWYETWLEVYKKNTVRATSYANYVSNYERYIRPEIGFIKLSDINTAHIQKLLNTLHERGYMYKTVLQVRIILVDMFEKAIVSEYMTKNPAKGATVIKGRQKERRVLTIDEQACFLQAAAGDWYEPLFYVALLTGLRQGELCALTWDDIDFEAKTLSVNKTLIYSKDLSENSASYKINPPKTAKGSRVVPLTAEAVQALKMQRLQYEWLTSQIGTRKNLKPIKGFENLVFYTRMATPVSECSIVTAIKTVIRHINKSRTEDEPEFAYFSPHTFRHTFATRCFENGMLPKTLQELLGHNSLEMTMDLYTHVTEEMKRQEASKIAFIGMNPIGVKLA